MLRFLNDGWGEREQLLHRNVQRFRGGLVFNTHRLLYHSILGLRLIKKKKTCRPEVVGHPLRHEVVDDLRALLVQHLS